jgi:hypothetical protein
VLALRRFPFSSVGPGYTSIWHRSPQGAWTFYANVDPRCACQRYFGAEVEASLEDEISVEWTGPRSVAVSVGRAGLDWLFDLAPSGVTRALNAVGRAMPERLWRSERVLSTLGRVAGWALQAGTLGLSGRLPNGQRFRANPRLLWLVSASRASLNGTDFGPPAPLREQAHLADFWIPQRGILAFGQVYVEAFDAARHLSATTRAAAEAAGRRRTERERPAPRPHGGAAPA